MLLLATSEAHAQEWAEYGYGASIGVGIGSTPDQGSVDKLHTYSGQQGFVASITALSVRAEFLHRIRLHLSATGYFTGISGRVVSGGREYDVGGQYLSWHSAVAAGGVLHVGRIRCNAVAGPVFVLPYSGDGETSEQIHLESTLEPRTLLGIEVGAEVPLSDKADSSSYLGGALRIERRLDKLEDVKVVTDGSGRRLRLDLVPVTTVVLQVSFTIWYL